MPNSLFLHRPVKYRHLSLNYNNNDDKGSWVCIMPEGVLEKEKERCQTFSLHGSNVLQASITSQGFMSVVKRISSGPFIDETKALFIM